MDEERKRILRMVAEGTISVEECDELLRALSDRRTEKTEKDVQAVQDKRPVWPYVMLVILAMFALPASFAGFRLVPRFSGLIGILAFIFWVWMIVDCLSRLPCDFKLLFTTQHRYEKWIWLAVVILAFPVGSIVYFFIIRQPSQQISPPSTKEKPPSAPKPPAPPERPLRPTRRARSLKGLFIITILLAIAGPVIVFSVPHLVSRVAGGWLDFQPRFVGLHAPTHRLTSLAFIFIIPGAILLMASTIFWIWMIIDCLARDYREFGTLITSDKSADKVLWLLLILFTFIIGAIAYHISIRRRPVRAGG